MKPWTYYAAGFAVATSMTLASCGDDDTVDVPNRAPTVSVSGAAGTGRIADLPEASVNEVTVVADDADGNLNAITFFRDGTQVTAASGNVRTDATTPILNNPAAIVDEKDGFTRSYFFRTAADAGDSVQYTIVVTDEDQDTASTSFTLVNRLPLTRIERELEGILLNAAGPAGQGGLDLDLGEGTGSRDTLAEIRDAGIDTELPNDQNWLRSIEPVDGATIRRVNEDYFTEEGITFDDVEFTEQIISAYSSTSVDVPRSNALDGGEVFAVFDNDTYYLIEIESVTTTEDNNADSYVINIKY